MRKLLANGILLRGERECERERLRVSERGL